MADKIYDVIIIGSGPAGMTASIYCVRKGLDTLIIGKEVGGQVAKSAEIENYLGFGSSTGQELTQNFHEHVKSFENIKHIHDVLVKKIEQNDDKFTAITEENQYEAKSLIIASGRKPRKLGIPGEEEFRNKGVSYCETCDAPLFKDKKTAVIGGGNSGLEAVMSLVDICPKVYLLEYAKELNADKILQDKIKKLDNVEIITNAETTEIVGDKFVTGLKYKDRGSGEEKEIELKGVFIEIGWKPSIDFDNISPKNDKNEIIVDKQCRTDIDGLFAAGDITDIGYWQIIIAAGEGAKAALSAYDYISKNK
ncbi:MAG: FAD-binding protein [Candidatus Buchananbacteria bacterium]|nr:FAD-binding protein [Candidatus Buchananbacteria bacterium]